MQIGKDELVNKILKLLNDDSIEKDSQTESLLKKNKLNYCHR